MQDIGAIVEIYFNFFLWAFQKCFTSRHLLPDLTEGFCEFLETYNGPREELHRALERVIVRVLETHRMFLKIQGSHITQRCRNQLFHTAVLVVGRLAFRCGIPNSFLVARIVGEIYSCDKDLRDLFMGAYLDKKKCWSFELYKDRVEGVAALEYFLYHTNVAKKVFYSQGLPYRLADLSLNVPHFYHPAVYSIATDSHDVFTVLAAYGADLCDKRLPDFSYSVKEKIARGLGVTNKKKAEFRRIFFVAHPEFQSKMPSLMDLARAAVRRQLRDEFLLPWGVHLLPLPPSMKKYLDFDPF